MWRGRGNNRMNNKRKLLGGFKNITIHMEIRTEVKRELYEKKKNSSRVMYGSKLCVYKGYRETRRMCL